MKSIVIADTHSICREALCDYLRHASADLQIENADSYNDMIGKINLLEPELILVDVDLLGGLDDPLETLSKNLPADLPIGVMLSLKQRDFSADKRIKGVFPKSLSSKAFHRGIDQILEGGTFFPPLGEHADIAQAGVFATRNGQQDFNLTVREKEVLTYLVKGASNKEIARALDLQVVTVKLHVRGICRKLKASNRTQAALAAKESGWG